MVKPVTLHSHRSGPNPWRVAIVLEELNIPYETKFIEMQDVKKPPYTKINPNGRVPAIEDPNTGITLWESQAIIDYLVDQYDKEKKLTYTSFPEKWLVKQWQFFQSSGQGPSFGQAYWFTHFHHEKVDSAIKRYTDETKRILYVLNKHLSENVNGGQWLVGDKCTIADLGFVPWDMSLGGFLGDEGSAAELEKNYPAFYAWHQRLMARPAVKKIVEDKNVAMSTKA